MSELMVRDDAIMPGTFEGMMAQAEVLVKSGMLPVEVKSASAAVAIMLTGRELGIPPMQAFRSVYVVKGKPTLSAQLMGALIFRAGHTYRVIESSNEKCVIEFRRRGGTAYRHEFTAADANRAGLTTGTNSHTWTAYPKAMLFSRCMSAGARVAMPDVLAGMYTPEEMAVDDAVIVDDAGEVIDVVAKPAAPTEPTPEAANDVRLAWRGKGNQRWFHAKLGEMALSHDEAKRLLGRRLDLTLEHFEDSGLTPEAAITAIGLQVADEIGDEQASEEVVI